MGKTNIFKKWFYIKIATESNRSVEYILEWLAIWAFSFSSKCFGHLHYLFMGFCWCLLMSLKKLSFV